MSEGSRLDSLWNATLPPDHIRERPSLPGDLDADVAIVGAGYTGLWTAYALLRAEPSTRVVVCEAEHVGFGASGRNGGWCSAAFAGSRAQTVKTHGRDGAIAMQRAMFATLDDMECVTTSEQIDADWARGGTLQVATLPVHVDRVRHELEGHRAFGFGDEDYRWLDPTESRAQIGCTPNLGALYTPHCAAVHPAKLVHGLAAAVERKGARVYERTPVTSIDGRRVRTAHGTVRADLVVRATEAFTQRLPRLQRALVPIYSLMIATEPLSDDFWRDAGLAARPTFTDGRQLLIYGQRTRDGRFAFGGRGAPYHYASRLRPAFDREPRVFADLDRSLRALFPALDDHRATITHRWGGAVAVPRDWYPSVGCDRTAGIAWAGGYVGDGVATSNLAGRTLADLILGRESELVRLPWVGHTSPEWEPEPLRWLGVNAARALITSIDRAEARGRVPRRRARMAARLFNP
jgi:glycine/D-amino acid oxidase-like deaminating enzyme